MQSPKCLILINTAVSKLLPPTAIVSVHNPQSEDKSWLKKTLASLLCLYLTAFFVCQILSQVQVRTESQYHLNHIPSIHVCAVVSPAALLPLPKLSEQLPGVWVRTPKGIEKAVLAKGLLHLRNISLLEVPRICPSSSEAKWVNNGADKTEGEPGLPPKVRQRGSHAQGDQEFQVVSPTTLLNTRLPQATATSG